MSQPTPSGGANVEKTLGFVVFLGALLGDWPDELDDRLRRLTPDLRRRVFAFASECAEIRARTAEETAKRARDEIKPVKKPLIPIARRLLSVPPDERTPEWREVAREIVVTKRSLDALPGHYADDARRNRALSRRLRAPVRLQAPRQSRRLSRPRARRPRRSSSSSRTSGADPGDHDGESEPAGGLGLLADRRSIAGGPE